MQNNQSEITNTFAVSQFGECYLPSVKRNTFEKIDRGVSTVLGGAVRLVDSPYGGLSLDVDDEADYVLLRNHYSEWMAEVRDLDERLGSECPPSEQGEGQGRPERDQQDAEEQPEKERHG